MDERALVPVGTAAVVAVSGGRDSVALLQALVERGKQGLVIGHFDHGLRAESAAEAEFVEELARGYGLPCEVGRAVRKARRGGSVETAAREARYAFLEKVAARLGCGHVYLAHHADDQAETLLFHLLRGSGAAGLRGMRPVTARGGLWLHRPLLRVWREEIDCYVRARALRFCEDPSNQAIAHTRNRLRHELIPALEAALGRNVRGPLARAAEILGAEDEFLASLVPPLATEFEVKELLALPLALQRRAVHGWLRTRGVAEVGFEEVEKVLLLATQRVPAKINLAQGCHARRRAGRIFLENPARG